MYSLKTLPKNVIRNLMCIHIILPCPLAKANRRCEKCEKNMDMNHDTKCLQSGGCQMKFIQNCQNE